jgi:DNA-binding response OmpR family regulator
MTATGRKPHVVLIVEHDDLLKSLTVDLMEHSGFVALQAWNADEALAVLERRSDVTLLLTSITMPSTMDGLTLARAVRKRWPTIKVIVASGQVRLMGFNLPTGCGFIAKPYHADEMISKIHSMIGA